MRVTACIPSYGDPKLQFVECLLALQKRALLAGMDFKTEVVSRTLIDIAREELVTRALRGDADYLLWLDVDMVFPADTLDKLLAPELPVVGANARVRNDGVGASSATKRASMGGRSGFMPIQPKTEGLEEVDAMGLAVCLMKVEVFRDLPQPWFAMVKQGEDGFFFERLFEQKGIRPVVDHALSMECGHVAEIVLRFPR
jgi:hypothetical protein